MKVESQIKLEEAPPHPCPLPQGGEGGPPQCVPDGGAIGFAQARVERKAKEAGKAAQELSEAAEQLSLTAMADVPEFEPVMLEPVEEIRKRYTAKHAQEIEIRRNAAIYMLARQCPVEDIARILRMNLRTVSALAALNAEALAAFSQDYADWLNRGSAKAFAHALLKLPEANALQAATVGGIMADKAQSVRAGVPQGAGDEPVIDVTAEDVDLKKFREGVKALKSARTEDSGLKVEDEKTETVLR